MVKLVDKQNIFNAGIVSTKLHSRDDLKQFNNGIADASNFICSRYGPIEKRVGTQFIWDLDTYGQDSFFLPFVFSIKQSLLLEFLANKIRFYAFDPGEGIQFAPIADPGHTWLSSQSAKVYTASDDVEVGDTVYSDDEMTISAGTISHVGEGAILDVVTLHDVTNTDGVISGFDSDSYVLIDGSDAQGVVAKIHTGNSVGEDIIALLDGANIAYTFSGRKTVLEVTPSGDLVVSNTYVGPEDTVGTSTETLTCTRVETNETPNPIVIVGSRSGSTDFGTGNWDWRWSESGNWLGGSLGSGYVGSVTYRGGGIGWDSAYGMHPSQSYTFPTPLPAGEYIFQCCSNGVGSGYRLYYTSNGVETQVTLPALSTSQWSYTDPITTEYPITSVRAEVITRQGTQGIGSVRIISTSRWENSSQEAVDLADYNLVLEGGTPVVGSTINLEYTTTQVLEADTDYFVKMFLTDGNCQISVSTQDEAETYVPVATVYGLSDLDVKVGLSFLGTLNLRQSYLQLNRGVSFLAYEADFISVNDTDYVRKDVQYEISTPFSASQIKGLDYVQSLDVIYLAFADGQTQPYTLSRYANDHWKLQPFVTEDGPYLDQNYSTAKKVTITDKLTATSTVTLTGFTLGAADVGRWIRINTPRYNENTYAYEDKWSYGKIASVASGGASITVDWSYRNKVDESDQSWMTSATSEWRLGVWHTGTGNSDYPVTFPKKVCIHQQRLVWAGTTDKPWLWMSDSFAYNNYAPSDYGGEITDAHAIYRDMSTDKVSEIFWVESMKSMLVGTELGEIRVISSGIALTPSDIVASRESSYGSYNGKPIVTDDMIVFIQRLQRTIRSLTYDHNYDSYTGPELTLLVEGLTTGGIKKIVYQKEPNNTIWCIKEDGSLLTLTYDKTQEVIGWSKSALAGDAKVVDLAVLPSDDYLQDMVFFVVERNINGDNVRYLELLTKNFTDDVQQKDAWFLDCATRFQSETPFTTLDGLEYIEGQKVRVMTEGKYYGDFTVKDGMVTLFDSLTDALVGLPYDSFFTTLERDFGDKQISTKMSKLRIYKLRLYLVRTLGLLIHRLERGDITMLKIYDSTDKRKLTKDYVTGKIDIEVQTAWDCDYRLHFYSEPGLPCTISGIIAGVEINEL